jgi:energy-coupling factor transporter ATP-binding protein EcfA2
LLERVRLRFGSSEKEPSLDFSPGPMTVLVGPNNSGKSLLLREIEKAIGKLDSGTYKIVADIGLGSISREDVLHLVFGSGKTPGPEESLSEAQIPFTAGNQFSTQSVSYSFQMRQLFAGLSTEVYDGFLKHAFAYCLTVRLDGSTRLSLTHEQPTGNLLGRPENHLWSLFADQVARERIGKLTAESFGLHFVIDPTSLQRFRVRMSARAPSDPMEEQSLDPRAREFHRQATPIDDLSDGIKAFTGLVAAVLSANFRIMIIDEPEAFLHPPLVRKLGRVLTETAFERGGNVLAATHSTDFIVGCIQAGKPVNIVHLAYDGSAGTARLLPSDELRLIMRDPLLRSIGVLSALFHRGAVICEGDIDRVFYEEVNERLVVVEEGARDVLFANAINKQTIHRPMSYLRRMGVPAAAVVDLDILKEGDLSRLLRAANVPDGLVQSWGNLKRNILGQFERANLDPKLAGVEKLDEASGAVANNLIANVAEYGVFIVPVGEVEGWLSDLGATGAKTKWLTSMLTIMRENPSDADYVRPRPGDVWDFVRQIGSWIGNPHRKGMSS